MSHHEGVRLGRKTAVNTVILSRMRNSFGTETPGEIDTANVVQPWFAVAAATRSSSGWLLRSP
jgi:hypothetical protein